MKKSIFNFFLKFMFSMEGNWNVMKNKNIKSIYKGLGEWLVFLSPNGGH